jgi:hypothetical protein
MHLTFRRAAVAAAALLVAPITLSSSAALAADVPATLPPLTMGRTTVGWSGPGGLSLAVDGVPVVRRSTLYLVKPGWSGTLLDQTKVVPVVSGWKDAPGGGKTATVTLESPDARCDYTLAVSADGAAVTVDMAYRLKKDVPAVIEYGAAYLSGPVLQGAKVAAPSGAGLTIPVAGALPTLPQEQRRLLSPFTDLRFDTRLGGLGITYTGDSPKPVLFDARRDSAGWATEYPVFWMGIGSPEQPVSFADGVRHATFRFSISPPAPSGGALSAWTSVPLDRVPAGRVTAYRDAYVPVYASTPLVLPRPKQMEVAPAQRAFRLTNKTRLIVRDGATAEDRRGATLLRDEIRARYGLTLPIIEAKAAKDGRNAIMLGEPDRTSGQMTRAMTGLPPAKPEGYTVTVSPESVLVAGRDAAGTLWGAQTVIQLLAADAAGPLVRPVVIHDWPTLALRGVHLFHGRNALPFHQKLIDRVLARYKMNALFLQAEQAKWDTDPLVAPDWGGSKADLKAEVAYAKQRGMTVYPLVQGYGHMEWLFSRERNREFAEDPQTPYAVNFSNPAAVSYLTRFVDEADATFGAPGFHVGLDEIDMRGRFPYRSKPKTKPELIVDAARYWHKHLRARGKEMWMWADMAISRHDAAPSWGSDMTPEETAFIRAGIPKDVVMVDWQYSPRSSYPSLKKLKDAGFTKLVAATWYDQQGNQNFSKAAADIGALGAMITTWAGYESKEDVLNGPERRQFVSMIVAADYFWNGGEGPAPEKLPYDPTEVFARQWAGADPAANRVRPGYTMGLGAASNRPLPDWLGYGAENGPAALPVGKTVRLADGGRYQFGNGVALLAGKLNPAGQTFPPSLPVPLGEPAREVRLLLAASHPATMGTKIGAVTVKRTDGTTDTVDLVYGKNIAALTDARSLDGAVTAWRGSTGAGEPALLRSVRWEARGDTAPAASVTVTSADTEAAPALFAVTGLTR